MINANPKSARNKGQHNVLVPKFVTHRWSDATIEPELNARRNNWIEAGS